MVSSTEANEDDLSERPDDQESGVAGAVLRVLLAIRGSFLLFTIAVGILMTLAGFLLGQGVIAGLLGLLGASAVVYGFLGYLVIELIGY